MELLLEIVSEQQFVANTVTNKKFKQAGGIIGRAPDCDWIIADPKRFVSGHHAIISTQNGKFYITDISSNGTILKDSGSRLPPNQPYPIEHGSIFSLGDYDIRARLIYNPEMFEDVVGSPVPAGSIIPDDAFLDLDPIRAIEQQPFQYVDLDELADLTHNKVEYEQPQDYARLDIESLEMANLVEDIPEEKPTAVVTPQPVMQQPQQPQPSMPQRTVSDLFWQKFATILGIDLSNMEEEDKEQLALNAARLFKQCIGGLQQSLRTRTELKNELRLPLTSVQATGNNPLRYTLDPESAIRDLLQKHNPNQITPEQAINRAYRDLQSHQVALLAACRAAVRGVITQFSPDQLTLSFEKNGEKGFLGGNAWKWNAYCRYHQTLQKDSEWSDRLFSKDFTQSYEEQVRLLASIRDN